MLSTALATTETPSLQETYDAFMAGIREFKPLNTPFSFNFNLSCVKVDNPLTELLRADISNNKKFIVNAYIAIEIDTQTNEELRYIAKYICSLELSQKSLHILERHNPQHAYIKRLMFLIENLKAERFVSLSLTGSHLGYSLLSREDLFKLLGNVHFQILDLQATDLKTLRPEDLVQHLSLIQNTGVACIDLSRNPIVEGEKIIEFSQKWFSLNHTPSKPHLKLYSGFNDTLEPEILKTQPLIASMDPKIRFKLASSYYASYLLNNIYRSSDVTPISNDYFKLSNEEKGEILKLLATLGAHYITKDAYSFVSIFRLIASALVLDSSHRYLWIKSLIKESDNFCFPHYLKELEVSKLSEKDKWDLLFLISTKHSMFFYVTIGLLSFSLESEPGYRILSAFENVDLDTAYLIDDGEMASLIDQSIPALAKQSEIYLGQAYGFIYSCATKILTQYENHGKDASHALMHVIPWFGLVCSKIDRIMPDLTPILQSAIEMPDAEKNVVCLDVFNGVMKQIFDFAHPTGRYALSHAFLEKICMDERRSYFSLTANLPLDALLPAIPLTSIVLQEKNPTLKAKHETLAKELLPLLASRQFYGRFQRSMVAGLMSIADDTSLTPSRKFDIIQAAASKKSQHKESENLLESIFELAKQSKTPGNDQSIDNLLSDLQKHDPNLYKKLQLSIWGFGSQSSEQEPSTTASKDQKKLSSLLQKMGPRIARDLEGIDKATKPLKAILKTHYEDAHFKRMISRFIMVQGLAGINRLSILCGFDADALQSETSTLEVFDLQARLIFQEIFNIKPEQFEHYQKTFEQCHNESALLTYYSKLCTLKGEDSEQTMAVFKSFVQGVLSPDSADFYKTRYNKTKNSHLALVLEGRETLEKAWIPESGPTDYTTPLTPFIRKQDIKHRDYEPDFRRLIETKIFGHQHLDPQYYQNLKQYLAASDKTEKAAIKAIIQAALPVYSVQKHTNDTDENTPAISHEEIEKKYHAKLELALLELLEIPVDRSIKLDKRYAEHLEKLQTIYLIVSRLTNADVFEEDIKTLKRGLQNNQKPVQAVQDSSFPGYKLVVTDQYWPLFMSGTDPEGSCQSVDGTPNLNKCLMGYVMNGHVKMVAILDPEGIIVGRCMIKLLKNETTEEPVLFLEEIYPESLRADFREALIQYAIQYTEELGLPLATLQTLPFGYESAGSQVPTGETTSSAEPVLGCAGGYAVYEYVDAVFEATQGPYSIEKGIQWIYQPALQPIQAPVLEEIAELRQKPEPVDTIASVQASMPPVEVPAAALIFAYGRLSETSNTVVDATPKATTFAAAFCPL